MKKIKLAILGAGLRGAHAYAPYILNHPSECELVAVAELDKHRRENTAKKFNLPDEAVFVDAADFLKEEKMADAVLICTMDRSHYGFTIEAIKKGYHILLEKPISPDPKECMEIERLAKEHGTLIVVCHVLRYTNFYKRLKEILDSGAIGDIVSVTHAENVGHWHQAHSFVRGNWRNSEESSPMILQKCCHDMDILSWLVNSRCKSVSSYGGLTYFKSENAPEGAPKRCTDGCPHSGICPYYAPKVYLEGGGWLADALGGDPSYEAKKKALVEGPYGRCVFHCDNDVADHQVAALEFENGVTVSFSMCAFTKDITRTMKFMGTKGELRGYMEKNEIEITNFSANDINTYKIARSSSGHGGGDFGIMETFVKVLQGAAPNTNLIGHSVHSHIIAFAAEESRIKSQTVVIKEYEDKILNG